MADSTINNLPTASAPARTDVLPLEDISANQTQKITPEGLFSLLTNADLPAHSHTTDFDTISPTTSAGDIIVHDGSDNVRVAVGASGTILTSDPGAAAKVSWQAQRQYNNPNYARYYEEFLAGSGGMHGFILSTNGTGASAAGTDNPDNTCLGVIRMNTGTTATGRSAVTTSLDTMKYGQGTYSGKWKIRLSALSTATEEFIVQVGYSSATSNNPLDGLYFKYDRLISTNWLAMRSVNSVQTYTDTGVEVPTFTSWSYPYIHITAGGVETMSINGVSVTPPSGTLRSVTMGMVCSIVKTAGLTARTLDLDYVDLVLEMAGVRS